MKQKKQTLAEAVIRFAGDSGDGMQLSGLQFSNTSGTVGNDVNTFPDYPSEIRAPEEHFMVSAHTRFNSARSASTLTEVKSMSWSR
jgi:Pyruvate/2-oxoacid:ferredoxin oxidoreductase gamma subunit